MPDVKKPDLGKAGLTYAKMGMRVFPCHTAVNGACSCGKADCGNAAKHPRTLHGCLDATTDPELLKNWWAHDPDSNVGIATGNGLLVLDVDPQHGGAESLEILEAENGKLPETPTVLTGGGGKHLYFSVSVPIKNKVALEPGVDIRAEGGYVIAPPSLHLSGRRWLWEESSRIDKIERAPAPAWLVARLSQPGRSNGRQANGRLVDPATILAGVKEGERDTRLFSYAAKLREEGRPKEEAMVLLEGAAANCKPPFPVDVAREKVERAYSTYSSKLERQLEAMEVTEPEIDASDRTVRVDWVDKQIFAVATSLKEHSEGDINGFLKIGTTLPGHPRDLHAAKFNFAALRSRTEWANLLTKRVPITDWVGIMESLCKIVTDHVQKGEPVIDVGGDDEAARAEHVLWPLILYQHPTILFGEPGTTKSYLAALIAHLVSAGGDHLDFRADRPVKSPLYLDWEGDRESTGSRLALLRAGLGLPKASVAYRRCARPLAADVDRIKAEMAEKGTEFVVIDSLGPACGGNLNDSQPPVEFFTALRSLGCTSLILAHTAKHSVGQRSVFGSVFFGALARSIWEVRRDQEEDSDTVSVGLIHRKANYGRLEKPVGLRFTFEDGRTLVTREDVQAIAAADAARPLTYRIVRLLEESGKMTAPQIAQELEANSDTVRVLLNRLRDGRKVVRLEGGKWAAAAEGEEGKGRDIVPF